MVKIAFIISRIMVRKLVTYNSHNYAGTLEMWTHLQSLTQAHIR